LKTLQVNAARDVRASATHAAAALSLFLATLAWVSKLRAAALLLYCVEFDNPRAVSLSVRLWFFTGEF
jgi:hypothetical protein